MLLGWVFGRDILVRRSGTRGPKKPERVLLWGGLILLAIFLLVRGLNGYGNMFMALEGGRLLSWLHVSKYPPSISFAALELGLMGICLWALFVVQRTTQLLNGTRNPVVVFGQTALMFYIVHLMLFVTLPIAFGIQESGGVAGQYIGALIMLTGLYPFCLWYRKYKAEHPGKWVRFF